MSDIDMMFYYTLCFLHLHAYNLLTIIVLFHIQHLTSLHNVDGMLIWTGGLGEKTTGVMAI